MRAADVPVEILGLDVERECGGQDFVQLRRYLAHGFGGKVGRRIKRRGRLAARVEGSDFVVHGITFGL